MGQRCLVVGFGGRRHRAQRLGDFNRFARTDVGIGIGMSGSLGCCRSIEAGIYLLIRMDLLVDRSIGWIDSFYILTPAGAYK